MGLLERGAELAVLTSRWQEATAGRGSMVVLAGEAGIGKTELVRHFVAEAVRPGTVLFGACDPLTTPRPLGPLQDLADELGPTVRVLLRDGAAPHEVFEALHDHLRVGPRLLVVDDLQWADEGTLDLLRFLLRRVAATSALVVVAYRDDEVAATHLLRALLGDVARSPSAVRLQLQPLSVDAVATLIGERALDATVVHRLTRGNPFFVSEVLLQPGATLPPTVRDAVLARTMALDDGARELLDLLACAPEGIPDLALPALGVGLPALRTLDAAGLIERGRRGVSFRHDICRLAVASALPPGAQVVLHRRMLATLESLGAADAAVLAHHALEAGDRDRVLRYSSLAGTASARAGAHTEAAKFYETALAHAQACSHAEQAELLELRALELYLTGSIEDAIAAATRAAALREVERDLPGLGADLQWLSLYEYYNGDRTTAERHASTAVDVLEPIQDEIRLGHAYATEAYLALQSNDADRARSFLERARRMARGGHDRRLDVRIEMTASALAVIDGDLAGRTRILSMVQRDMEHFDEAYSSGYSNLAYLDVEQRRFDDAQQVLHVSLPLTFERDVPTCNRWQLGARARLRFLRGEWDDALVDADDVLSGSGAVIGRTWPHVIRGLIGLRRGQSATDDDFDAAWDLACRLREPLRQLPVLAALAERSWLHGAPDERLDDAVAVAERAAALPGTEWALGDVAVWMGRLGRAVGSSSADLPAPYRHALEGEHGAAAAAWAELGCPYERALALVECEDGVAEGMEVLEQLGADAVAAKLRQDLRQRGTAVPSRRRGSTRSNPAGLTDRQLEVLALLADGLTNAELAARLYISPKTADHHVSAVLTKLGIASRRQAADAARSLGVVD